MKWRSSKKHRRNRDQEAPGVTDARRLEKEVDRKLAESRRSRPFHEKQGERVMEQMSRNHFGELMRVSMEGR